MRDTSKQELFLHWMCGQAVSEDGLATLSGSDWNLFKKWCVEHRLAPLVKQAAKHSQVATPEFSEFIDQASKRQIMRQLQVQRELVQLDKILKAQGIPYIILKGPVLAFTCYPRSELRPMRDIDILVPKSRAIEVFNLLLDAGCTRIGSSQEAPESKLDSYKHLPAILGISASVTIEVHTRVFNQHEIGSAEDFSLRPDFWASGFEYKLGNRHVVLEDPTYLLSHLIFHAVYEHQLNNGPLVLADIYYLLQAHTIDWDKFDGLVSDLGMTKGVSLVFALMKKYYRDRVTFPSRYQLDDQEMLRSSEVLLFADFETRGSRSVIRSANTHTSKWGWICSTLFPEKQKVAQLYELRAASPVVYLYYIANWCRLLLTVVPQYLRTILSRDDMTHTEARSAKKLGKWLSAVSPDQTRRP